MHVERGDEGLWQVKGDKLKGEERLVRCKEERDRMTEGDWEESVLGIKEE